MLNLRVRMLPDPAGIEPVDSYYITTAADNAVLILPVSGSIVIVYTHERR